MSGKPVRDGVAGIRLGISRAWKVWYFATAAALTLLFSYFNEDQRGTLVVFSFAAIAAAIHIRWDLRGRTAFWVLMAFWIVIHAAIIFSMDWHIDVHPEIQLLPFVMLDLSIVAMSTTLIDRFKSS